MQSILLVFLKYPEPGKVKTRLAAEVGPQKAVELYREWIGMVLNAIQPIRGATRVVGYVDGAAADQFTQWAALVDQWLPQPAGALGERLVAGFEWGFISGGPVVAIGTDCLEINHTHIEAAVTALGESDAVFGPATDGGYYLVGARRLVDEFFDDIRWSSPSTLSDHLERCRQLHLRVSLLPTLADIDTAADWQAYLRRQGDHT